MQDDEQEHDVQMALLKGRLDELERRLTPQRQIA
jgi:hypothetical protein